MYGTNIMIFRNGIYLNKLFRFSGILVVLVNLINRLLEFGGSLSRDGTFNKY